MTATSTAASTSSTNASPSLSPPQTHSHSPDLIPCIQSLQQQIQQMNHTLGILTQALVQQQQQPHTVQSSSSSSYNQRQYEVAEVSRQDQHDEWCNRRGVVENGNGLTNEIRRDRNGIDTSNYHHQSHPADAAADADASVDINDININTMHNNEANKRPNCNMNIGIPTEASSHDTNVIGINAKSLKSPEQSVSPTNEQHHSRYHTGAATSAASDNPTNGVNRPHNNSFNSHTNSPATSSSSTTTTYKYSSLASSALPPTKSRIDKRASLPLPVDIGSVSTLHHHAIAAQLTAAASSSSSMLGGGGYPHSLPLSPRSKKFPFAPRHFSGVGLGVNGPGIGSGVMNGANDIPADGGETVEKGLPHINRALSMSLDDFSEYTQRSMYIQSNINNQIRLNVGGTIFSTTLATLTRGGSHSMFSAWFSRWCKEELQHSQTQQKENASDKEKHNNNNHNETSNANDKSSSSPSTSMGKQAHFIDRDPTYFSHILNYLRDGPMGVHLSSMSSAAKFALLKEARFYQLSGLVSMLESDMQHMQHVLGRELTQEKEYKLCTAVNERDITALFRRMTVELDWDFESWIQSGAKARNEYHMLFSKKLSNSELRLLDKLSQ